MIDEYCLPKLDKSDYTWDKNHVDFILINHNINTEEVIIQRLVHFAETLKLDQVGESSMKKLLNMNPQLENPIFLLSFTESTFTVALGINGSKLYNSIQKIKDEITESKLADACGAFGPGFGESLSIASRASIAD